MTTKRKGGLTLLHICALMLLLWCMLWFAFTSEIKRRKDISMNEPRKVWKAIINYGGGYRVEDDAGIERAGGLNSYHVIQEVLPILRAQNIKLEYYSEEETGLQPTQPFGPDL